MSSKIHKKSYSSADSSSYDTISSRKLVALPVSKSVVIRTPFEGDDLLVRTGTIGDGSCFYHSVLHAYSKNYASKNSFQKVKEVKTLREELANKLSIKKWKKIGGGNVAKVAFLENLHNILKDFYAFVSKREKRVTNHMTEVVVDKLIDNNTKKFDIYNMISELIPLDTGFEQNILPKVSETPFDKIEKILVVETIRYLRRKEEIQRIDKKKSDYFTKMTFDMVNVIGEEAMNSAYIEYINNIKCLNMDVDSSMIEIISDMLDRDIYIIDSKNKLPYNNVSNKTIKRRTSIILLWVGDNHYEIIGRMIPGNIIEREFSANDPIINKLYTFLFKPDTIRYKYPELWKYLPSEYKHNNSGSSSSSSEGSEGSEGSDNSDDGEDAEDDVRSNASDGSDDGEDDVRSDTQQLP